MESLQTIVQFVEASAQVWGQSIGTPTSQLRPAFTPDDATIATGLQFYLIMLAIPTMFYIALAAGHAGEFSAKLKLVINGFFGVLTSGIVAMIWHFPFKWFGGHSSMGGTYLAMVYGTGPYIPISSLCSIFMLAAVPHYLRPYAINPATAQLAYGAAQARGELGKGTQATGCLLIVVVMIASSVVTFYNMSFVHDLHGVRLVAAVVVSLIVGMPVLFMLQKITSVFAVVPE